MTTFLFWNLNNKPLTGLISALVQEHDVDVLILAESDITPASFLPAVNTGKPRKFVVPDTLNSRLQMYIRMPASCLVPLADHGGVSVRHLIPPVGTDIIIVAAHLPSKLHMTDTDQHQLTMRLANLINGAENNVGHMRTIIVGDLNMNPFEDGVAGSEGLHGVMSKQIAQRGGRTVQGEHRSFFYNPMWSLFGDRSPGPPGTYFYNRTGRPRNLFWNIFDQVLIRPPLLDAFVDASLQVLTTAGDMPLLCDGKPDSQNLSDHLPIVFELHL